MLDEQSFLTHSPQDKCSSFKYSIGAFWTCFSLLMSLLYWKIPNWMQLSGKQIDECRTDGDNHVAQSPGCAFVPTAQDTAGLLSMMVAYVQWDHRSFLYSCSPASESPVCPTASSYSISSDLRHFWLIRVKF